MRIINILLLALALSFAYNRNIFAQEQFDIIYLKNGSKVIGIIVDQKSNQKIKIRTKDGSEYVYNLNEIEKIRKGVFEINLKSIKEVSYFESGINLGTPSGINGAFGYWNGPIGYRITGMYYGSDLNGIQLNIGFKLSDNTKQMHNLALIAGTLQFKDENGNTEGIMYWKYIGLVYNLNFQGFFLETGLTIGNGSFSSPQLVFQIGYMHRFLQKLN